MKKIFFIASTIFLAFNAMLANAADYTKLNTKKMSYSEEQFLKMDMKYPQKEETDKIAEKARELEGVLLSVMMEPMFPEDGQGMLYGGGHGASVYRTLMLQEYGKIMSDAGGIGLAANIEKDIKKRK